MINLRTAELAEPRLGLSLNMGSGWSRVDWVWLKLLAELAREELDVHTNDLIKNTRKYADSKTFSMFSKPFWG